MKSTDHPLSVEHRSAPDRLLDAVANAIRLRPLDYLEIVEPDVYARTLLRRYSVLDELEVADESHDGCASWPPPIVANVELVDEAFTQLIAFATRNSPQLSDRVIQHHLMLEARFNLPVLTSVVYLEGHPGISYECFRSSRLPIRVFAATLCLQSTSWPRYLRPEPLFAVLALLMRFRSQEADQRCLRAIAKARIPQPERRALLTLARKILCLRDLPSGSS